VVVTALTICAVLYTRSAGVAYCSTGVLTCTVTAKLLKRILRQARPVTTHRKQKQTYGMPSTHSAAITFYGTYIPFACAWLPLYPSFPQTSLFRPLVVLVVVPCAFAVASSRIQLGHHTVPQVVVGCAYGFIFACGWFWLWTHGLSELGRIAEHDIRTYIG